MRIREHRIQRGLTQRQLAEKLGISQAAVGKWETGTADPRMRQLRALAEALECSIDELCGRQPAAAAPEQAAS